MLRYAKKTEEMALVEQQPTMLAEKKRTVCKSEKKHLTKKASEELSGVSAVR
jgi:hypothetical protein